MPVWKSFRYGNVVKGKLHQIELVKMKVYGYVKAGMEMLERKQYEQAHGHFKEVIKNQPGNFEAHFGFAQALCGMEEFEHAVPHLRFIAESSSLATEVRSLPAKHPDNPLDSSSLNPSFIAAPSQSLAIQSLIQWGSALTSLSEFSDAATLCEIVLRHDKNNASAESLKEMVRKRLTHQVMEAMQTAESNLRGKWYQCPEGHVYAVGDCGRPYAESRCPDCGSTIGGLHDLAAGNKHWH
ncbi:NFX1-type zinc finger-containing protein 1 [Selaginella moellendorffii]|uniref:NFX1-type zinc finger-containing protein 1 n=1 Tax=Selaginella moellendorffii TaxID=88036 RepID=UPI000D1C47FB|nr:NFX1-type zinc finger-containing protein 1 [Selaginella moellendorffii]|eukprot:XP_024542459.1 NFX1-type zinc finger-containing protein 1 [Selaginella moellendorffii]